MERTQRLLGVALAVLALDGCRGGSSQQANATATPGARVPHPGYAAGAAAGAVRAAHDDGRRGTSSTSENGEGEDAAHGSFGEAGAHGAGG